MLFKRKQKEKLEFELLNKKFINNALEYYKSISRKTAKEFMRKNGNFIKVKEQKVFFIEFKGDVVISNMRQVKEEINGLLSVAGKDDICLFSIESPGGTVTSYGELSYELGRIRESGIKLITVVDQVAASGGYMLAVQGNEILAAPNAVLGSIGVVVNMPNYKDMLDKVGVKFKDYTAGKNKRTVTPYSEPTPEQENSLKEDLDKVHEMFKDTVRKCRPKIDIERVSEGNTFFGKEALELGMIDGFSTSNEIIYKLIHSGHMVTKITFTKSEDRKFINRFVATIFDQFEKRVIKYLRV